MRRALVVLAAVAVLVTVLPTAGLSATQADRDVTGVAAADGEAYVGVDLRVVRPDPPTPTPSEGAGTDGNGAEATDGNGAEATDGNATAATDGNATATTDENATATPAAPTEEPPMEVRVTLRNRLPNAGGFTAVVSVEHTLDGDTQTVSEHVVVDDEATATLSPVSCDDAVHVLVRTDDASVELTRPVPCED